MDFVNEDFKDNLRALLPQASPSSAYADGLRGLPENLVIKAVTWPCLRSEFQRASSRGASLICAYIAGMFRRVSYETLVSVRTEYGPSLRRRKTCCKNATFLHVAWVFFPLL
jgi:hypothetical protein